MSVPPRLGLVTLGTVDLPRLRAFYEALGWPVAVEETDFCLFHTAGALLALYPRPALSAEAGGGPQAGEGFRHFSLAVNVASVAEVDAAIAAAVATGGSVLHEPRTMFWGGYSGYFADPEGNAWEVAHHPFWPLDDRGLLQIPTA